MANSISDVLIAVGVIAAIGVLIWLYERGYIRIYYRVQELVKTIFKRVIIIAVILYIVSLICFIGYKAIGGEDYVGLIVITLAGGIFGVSYYLTRWRRWWIKFLRTFLRKDEMRALDLKIGADSYEEYDYSSGARYCLRPKEGVFIGTTRIFISPDTLDDSKNERLRRFEYMLRESGIENTLNVDYTDGCIYADVSVTVDCRRMNVEKQTLLRNAFIYLKDSNYQGGYFGKYVGEYGTILFQSTAVEVVRAVRVKPREEYYIYPDSGFQSEDAYLFIEYYPDWTNGEYTLIAEKEFFSRWRKRTEFDNKDQAYTDFDVSSTAYFAAIENGDKKEQKYSREDIEKAALWLIRYDEVDYIKELLSNPHDETEYWAARFFHDVIPELAEATAQSLVDKCDNPVIVANSKRLLAQWRKEKQEKNSTMIR
ncbi:hypothetical protein [Bacteroides acidifaciens]|uniref:hypothetical protein n=1 Tax=Bacteroides acidifaciens TaxID=85831 RepID=UPI00259B67E1|nr:hypothetical protein [Bacteroides acidifaciens]